MLTQRGLLKQYFGWPDQPSSGLDVTYYKDEITILYNDGCRNIYFEILKGVAEMTNKTN